MNTGFIALNIFFIVGLTFIFLPGFLQKLKRKKFPVRDLVLKPSVSYGMYYIYLFTVVCIVVVCNTGTFDPTRNPDEVIRYAEKEGLYDHQYWAYDQKLKKYKYDYRSVYFFHLAHKHSEEGRRFREHWPEFNEINVPAGWEYEDMTESKVTMERELGYFGGAVVQQIYYNNPEEVVQQLDHLFIKNKPFVHCLYGLVAKDIRIKKEHLKKEMALGNGCKKEAASFFGSLCYHEQDYEGFEEIYNDPDLLKYVPPAIRQDYAFQNHHFLDFIAFEFERIFAGTTAFVFFCALVVLFIWLFFLQSIDMFERENRKYVLLTFGMSVLALAICSLLYEVILHLPGVQLNGEALNDFLYCMFCIGGIEEIVKILPFLIILRFTKAVNEPIDYLFYAGISALTFSVLEDVMYFNREAITTIYSRAIFTSVSHIADTSFIAYAMVIARYRAKKHTVLYFIAGFLFACLAHGTYDFFLMNETFQNWFVPFLILMLQVWWFVHIINNCLNNSPHFNSSVRLNTRNLGIIISGGLFTLIVMVYVHSAWNVSGQYATWNFFYAMIYYGYLLFFFTVCINRIDVFQHEWNRFSLRNFVDPRVFFAGINHRYSALPGRGIRLAPYGRHTHKLLPALPLSTTITRRLKIGDYTGWFVCELKFPLVLQGKFYHSIYIRTKDKMEPIENGQRHVVGVYGLRSQETTGDQLNAKDLVLLDWAFLHLSGDE
jgi:RsiW-degrading membrane proteinase PrsW (M82 family)